MPKKPFLYELEVDEPIPTEKLAYLRERMRFALYDFIIGKFERERDTNGLTKAELARRIGKKPEVINRLLSGPGNWRLDTLSDLLAGISGEELKPHSVSLTGRAPRNHTYPEFLDIHVSEGEVSVRKGSPLTDDSTGSSKAKSRWVNVEANLQ